MCHVEPLTSLPTLHPKPDLAQNSRWGNSQHPFTSANQEPRRRPPPDTHPVVDPAS